MELGTRIQQLRKARGISQERLAEEMGVSRQAVSKWEQGLSLPSTENLLALAELFAVSADELAGLAAAEPPRPRKRRVFPILLAALVLAAAGGIFRFARRPADPEAPDWESLGDFSLLWESEQAWEHLTAGTQTASFPFGTTLTPTKLETVQDTDYRGTSLHTVDCGGLSLRYLEGPEAVSLLSATTIVPGYETPRGICVGSTEADLLAAYGDALIYQLKDSGTAVLCRHEHSYIYSPSEASGTALIFYMDVGQVTGLALLAGDDMGSDAWAVDNISRFPVKGGQPDFSLRTEPETEDVDATRQVYIAWNALTTDQNLSAEDVYRLRQTVYENLQFMDWTAYGALGEAGRETETCMDLLAWLADQDTLSQPELTGLLAGGAGRSNLDGAFAEGYAAALTNAFLRYPETVCEILAGDGFSEQDQDYVIGGIVYGAWPADVQQQALEAAKDAVSQSHTEAARTIAWDIQAQLAEPEMKFSGGT